MKKVYRNAPKAPAKARKKTKAQLRREWEHTVLTGGLIRASAFERTAYILNKGRGAMVRVIGVPLASDGQLDYLKALAHQGLYGQTAEEVAEWFIRDGILRDIDARSGCSECGRKGRTLAKPRG
jgi:hypothetical protein